MRPADATPHHGLALGVGVHDRSKIEVVASIPLPLRGKRSHQVEFALEMPKQVYQSHDVWADLQSYSRLQSPHGAGEVKADVRRETLAAAHQLKKLREGLPLACASERAEEAATALVDGSVATVAQMRRRLQLMRQVEKSDLSLEEKQSDEFLSHQLLEFLATAQGALGADESPWAERLRDSLATALGNESEHRRKRGFLNPRSDVPAELSRFVERGQALNHHFADALALDTELVVSEKRLRNWTTLAAAASAASIWVALKEARAGVGAQLGIGSTLAMLFVVYALKDRIKDFLKSWVRGRITHFYGDRTLKLRHGKKLLIEARESFRSESAEARARGPGAATVVLRYRMRAEARASRELAEAGIERVKHIFHYDLSIFTARLVDSARRVPVMDPVTRRMTLADAPQEYAFPVHVEARVGDETRTLDVKLMLSKRGLERIAGAPQADSFAAETLV